MEQQPPINIQDLLQAIEQESKTAGPKVSIYFSVPHSSDYAILGRAELKADIQSVVERLKALRTPEEQRNAIVAKLEPLIASNDLWLHRSESYAIFASASFLRYYALPLPVRDDLWVNNDFQITPLIPLLSLPEHFYLLEVSLAFPKMARVHQQFSVPLSLEEVWAQEAEDSKEEPVHDRSFHTSARGGEHHGGIIPHGGSQDSEYRKRTHHIKLLAKAVDNLLKNVEEPLVLSGAEEVIQQLRSYLTYKNILVSLERIPFPNGNPIAPGTMVWRRCAKLFMEGKENTTTLANELDALTAQGRVAQDLNQILSFSAAGNVKTLVVNDNALIANHFDGSNFDVLNAALILTLRHHGNALQFKQLHSPTGVAALLRPGARV